MRLLRRNQVTWNNFSVGHVTWHRLSAPAISSFSRLHAIYTRGDMGSLPWYDNEIGEPYLEYPQDIIPIWWCKNLSSVTGRLAFRPTSWKSPYVSSLGLDIHTYHFSSVSLPCCTRQASSVSSTMLKLFKGESHWRRRSDNPGDTCIFCRGFWFTNCWNIAGAFGCLSSSLFYPVLWDLLWALLQHDRQHFSSCICLLCISPCWWQRWVENKQSNYQNHQ